MYRVLKEFKDDEVGATAIEYALIAGIVSLAIIIPLNNFTPELVAIFNFFAAFFAAVF